MNPTFIHLFLLDILIPPTSKKDQALVFTGFSSKFKLMTDQIRGKRKERKARIKYKVRANTTSLLKFKVLVNFCFTN